MKRRNWARRGAAAFVALAAGAAFTGSHFYNMAVKRSSKRPFFRNTDAAEAGRPRFMPKEKNWLEAHGFERVEIRSHDGLRLAAMFVPAEVPSGKSVVLAHGYSSKGQSLAKFAEFYHGWGFDVLLPDARGHGLSEGEYAGFGWHDRLDYVRWAEYLVGRLGEEAQIALHGLSMGGATVLLAGGEALPIQVKAIVSDCAYSTLTTQLYHHMRRMYPRLPKFPVVKATSVVTRVRAGYRIGEVSPLRRLRYCTVPVLFIHGDEDNFVPYRMVEELYAACPSEKRLLRVKGAGHCQSYAQDPEGYKRTVREFLDTYID